MPFGRRGSLAKVCDIKRSLLDGALRCLFLTAVILATFAFGWRVGTFEKFPHTTLLRAYKTAKTQIELLTREKYVFRHSRFVNIAPDSVKAHRFEFVAAATLADPILVPGGFGQFAEYCPGYAGCLAVEYAGNGTVVHTYPYRPGEIEKKPPLVAFPYEQSPGFSMGINAHPVSISQYANGDLLVIFQSKYSFPYALGVARIDREGRPIWYRRDYSHHEANFAEDDVALVPSMRIGKWAPPFYSHPLRRRSQCAATSYLDFVHVIDGEGRLLKETSIIDALLESPYAPILRYMDTCDPTHLNSVHKVGENAEGRGGIVPGDLVVSLRNISAFAILDGDTYRLKRLVRGQFFGQHSVKFLEGSRFLMFDNLGREGRHGPSRLLMVDVEDGTETTIFPNDKTPAHLRNMYLVKGGGISISPDRRRVIVTFSMAGKAVEVRLRDGAVLTVFNSVHDGSHLDSLPEERKTKARLFPMKTIRYIDSGGKSRSAHLPRSEGPERRNAGR